MPPKRIAALTAVALVTVTVALLWRVPSVRSTANRALRWLTGRPPNVLLISIDSLRADHLGAYGYARQTSPNLDALSREGVVFENAVSTSTWTLPAHISMLTSLYPEVHGVDRNSTRLGEEAILGSEVFQQGGFATGAVVSGPFLGSYFGYAQGFDLYDDQTISFESDQASHRGVTSQGVHGRAVEWLRTRPDKPFFLFLHYWDVHYDYDPPPPFDTRFDPDYQGEVNGRYGQIHPDMDPRDLEHILALYDGEIAYVDSYLGRLFQFLRHQDLWDQTLILVTSDHGDEFFEHGVKGHRKNLHQVTLQVPLLVKLPWGRFAGSRVSSPVGIVDLAPTMLEVAGLEVPAEFNGRSLLPLLEGRRQRRYYFADLEGKQKAVLVDGWKLINRHRTKTGATQLFDLKNDPGERRNLAGAEDQKLVRLEEIQAEWLRLVAASERPEATTFEYQEELKEVLRSLGYLD